MKKVLLLALFALACNRSESVTTQTAATSPTAVAGDAARGRTLAGQYGCNVCHTIPGVDGPQGSLAPSLQGFASRPTFTAGAVANTPENLAKFLQDPTSVNPQSSMPPIAINGPADVQDLVAFLHTLK